MVAVKEVISSVVQKQHKVRAGRSGMLCQGNQGKGRRAGRPGRVPCQKSVTVLRTVVSNGGCQWDAVHGAVERLSSQPPYGMRWAKPLATGMPF